MKYYIIAGEASGDLHGSNLMKGIYAEDPDAQIRFWGGDCMQSVWKVMESGAPGGIQDRATPLAAGGGAHEVGGVVLNTSLTLTISCTKISVNCNHCHSRCSIVITSQSGNDVRFLVFSAADCADDLCSFLIIRGIRVKSVVRTCRYRVYMGAKHQRRS